MVKTNTLLIGGIGLVLIAVIAYFTLSG